jgi:exonuclease III
MLCFSGTKEQNVFGTGFLVHRKLKSYILNFEPVDEHMCYLRMKGKFFNTTIFCVHAPTEEKDEKIKNSFCDRLDRTYQKMPKHDVKIIIGDMNAKVGKDLMIPNVGKFGLHDVSNDNGTRLADISVTRNLVISSTISHKKRNTQGNMGISLTLNKHLIASVDHTFLKP